MDSLSFLADAATMPSEASEAASILGELRTASAMDSDDDAPPTPSESIMTEPFPDSWSLDEDARYDSEYRLNELLLSLDDLDTSSQRPDSLPPGFTLSLMLNGVL